MTLCCVAFPEGILKWCLGTLTVVSRLFLLELEWTNIGGDMFSAQAPYMQIGVVLQTLSGLMDSQL